MLGDRIWYDLARKAIVFGTRRDPKMIIPDNAQRLGGVFHFTASVPSVTVGTLLTGVASFAAVGIKTTDFITYCRKTQIGSLNVLGVACNTDDMGVMYYANERPETVKLVSSQVIDLMVHRFEQ